MPVECRVLSLSLPQNAPLALDAANDRPLVQAHEPSLATLLADIRLVRDLLSEGLTLRHLSVLSECARRSEQALKAIS